MHRYSRSRLLRIDFQLANAKVDNGPRKLEGYTTFTSPSPFVMVPDTTVAVWWLRDAEHGDWGKPEFAQSLHVEDLIREANNAWVVLVIKHVYGVPL